MEKKNTFFVASQILGILPNKVRLIKSVSLSYIRWWGNVVYSVEKSYVDNLEAWKVLDLKLLRTPLEFLLTKNS